MDCCKTTKSLNENQKVKGGIKKMNKRIVLWAIIGILFLAVLYLTFKTGASDVSTVETAAVASRSAASQMVGGC